MIIIIAAFIMITILGVTTMMELETERRHARFARHVRDNNSRFAE